MADQCFFTRYERRATSDGLLLSLLTCPVCHAMISDVSEGNVDIMRINVNDVRVKAEGPKLVLRSAPFFALRSGLRRVA